MNDMQLLFEGMQETIKKPKKVKEVKDPCDKCGLYKNCFTPRMQPTGQGKKRILIIAEAPGKQEDEEGTQLVGKSGQLLRKVLDTFNIDLDVDCWKTNAIICRPPYNKTPTNSQINICRKNLLQTIEDKQPEKIIVLGKVALQSLIGDRMSITGIEKWTGWSIPDQHFKCWIFPTYHPAHILRDKENIILLKYFKRHIKNAIEYDKEFFTIDEQISILTEKETIQFLETLQETIAIDTETTGLKPYHNEHQIISISIATKNKCVSFYVTDNLHVYLKKVLENPDIKKIAHNLKFEHTWLKEILNIHVKGWIWDTQLKAHLFDNRTGITGLKFQTYVHFGRAEYDKHVSKYLEAVEEGFNKIKEVDPVELLTYNALDSFYTYKLFELQKKENNQLQQANDLMLEGSLCFSEIERTGIKIKKGYYDLIHIELSNIITQTEKEISESPEVRLWEEGKPKKHANKEFNQNSSEQLRTLLFNIMGYRPIKETAKGGFSVDIEVLEKLDIPFVYKIIHIRKTKKIRDTFIKGFIEENNYNYIHPFFNLNTVTTYRSSSSNPNLQNIPKHDETAQKYIRSGLIPREERQIVEIDYSGIEVRVSACYHKDPVMIAYINDPTSDMHRDTAKELFILDEIDREQRQLAKNNFVFPEFYGDYYKNCAMALWEKMGADLKAHLRTKKIRNYVEFEEHVQNIEYNFWYEKFKTYTKWKKDWFSAYEKRGYFESLTGFVYRGVLEKNKVINFPIQGSAFHCLLWSIIQLQKFIKESHFKTKIIGQIHDSIILDMCLDEKEVLKKQIRKIMCEDIRIFWPWIIVPFDIEMEVSEINGNWFDMKKEKI